MICLPIFLFQAEDGIRDYKVTGVQTCALPIYVPNCPTQGGIPENRTAVVHLLPKRALSDITPQHLRDRAIIAVLLAVCYASPRRRLSPMGAVRADSRRRRRSPHGRRMRRSRLALHYGVREDLPAVVGNVGSECILVNFSSNLPVPG